METGSIVLLTLVDYNAIAAWSALGAAVVALVGVCVIVLTLIAENRRSRFLLSVDLILKLSERFHSADFKRSRRAAARSLKDNTFVDFDDVLDFFELVGMLTKRKALDDEMVWATLFYWINNYWHTSNSYVNLIRQHDDTVWEYFCELRERMIQIEMRKRGSVAVGEVSSTELEKFVREELSLSPE